MITIEVVNENNQIKYHTGKTKLFFVGLILIIGGVIITSIQKLPF